MFPLFFEKLLVDVQIAILNQLFILGVQVSQKWLNRCVGELSKVWVTCEDAFVFFKRCVEAHLKELDESATQNFAWLWI